MWHMILIEEGNSQEALGAFFTRSAYIKISSAEQMMLLRTPAAFPLTPVHQAAC